jgi:hypothetical protein
VVARLTRDHGAILSSNISKQASDPEYQLSHCYFVPVLLVRVISYKLQTFSALHEMSGITVCGICCKTKFLVVVHEHHKSGFVLLHLWGLPCHTCNLCIMSVIDRLGDDKGYIINSGILQGMVDQAVTALIQYIGNELRDERLVQQQDDFNRCAAELFGSKFARLVGATHERRPTSTSFPTHSNSLTQLCLSLNYTNPATHHSFTMVSV